MKVAVEIHGCIDLPDSWGPDVINVADFHYNENTTAEDAINNLLDNLKEFPDDFNVMFKAGRVKA